ncbi:hypothetical protein A2721_02800 [Candidatus Gottesmanbacteria bacterium RIFCSPHIGHO2_01_FULL_47_48]|uniref:Glycogen synthase n=1 Tax=Candidatus Gottesmanbacteria bacterium RIFCSPHIGHO2_01_FULL_47_48 TaxID=1798381 RepID=A0A1F6A4R8_9BACT|nr:MAG: hypothetical protein A2721_02800 [Candidatus Gottesmanbacteria bacterium RIFCSPHIGHO2_01_FULL_47_48]
MTKSPLKVLFLSAEVSPFSSVGGLSQVAHFLPSELLRRGYDVRIFTPKYGTINEGQFPMKMVASGMKVPTGEVEDSGQPTELICNIKSFAEAKKGRPTTYFLENMEYFEKRANVYGYSDDHIRFALLSRGALEFIKQGYFMPDVVHVNDWHTSYFANYLREDAETDKTLGEVATLLSLHNLHQGVFDFEHATEMDFDDGKSRLQPFFSDRFIKQNPLKRGIIYADVVNTVSENYAHEILTEEYGRGLQNLLKELRGKLFGVLNGLDYTDFNPLTDKAIKKNFSSKKMELRAENKLDLQRQFGLEEKPEKPLLCFWGRVDLQKGANLISETILFILDELDVQFVIVGPPEDYFRDFFSKLEKGYPGQVGTHLMFDRQMVRRLAAGGDMLVMPSKYEPGGIVALEAMHYGCVPVVRATGGLADSVVDYDAGRNVGTGFTFKKFTREGFLVAIVRAMETYRNKAEWNKIIRRAMETDFSWSHTAEKYMDLYNRAVEFRKEALSGKLDGGRNR